MLNRRMLFKDEISRRRQRFNVIDVTPHRIYILFYFFFPIRVGVIVTKSGIDSGDYKLVPVNVRARVSPFSPRPNA